MEKLVNELIGLFSKCLKQTNKQTNKITTTIIII